MKEYNSLCYFRIEKAEEQIKGELEENLLQKDFMFDSRYYIKYIEKTLSISKNNNYIEKFFNIGDADATITNISSIIGKNGSGKTALLALFSGFIYTRMYINMHVIIVFMIDGELNIIAPKGLIERVEQKGLNIKVILHEYNNERDARFEAICETIYKKINCIYFSNVVGIRNNLFPSTNKGKNFHNISLMNDLQMNYKNKFLLMNSYWVNNSYEDDRFDSNDYRSIVNHRTEKNLKFITFDNLFNIPSIQMELNIYNEQVSFLDIPISQKLRIYDTFNKDNLKEIEPTITEQKIYQNLTKEFTGISNANNNIGTARNIINLAIIDKYFNELYCKLNNYNVIRFINQKIEEKIGDAISDYRKGFGSVKKLLEEITIEELSEIYMHLEEDNKNKEKLAIAASRECIEFLKDINKRYNNLFSEIDKIFDDKHIIKGIYKTGYSSAQKPYCEYQPYILIKKQDFEKIYKSIVNSSEIGELFYFTYKGLSTGEQALLDMYSEFYYIKDEITTDSILILMDEPELYFHPEWQRKLIYLLIDYFNKYFKDKKVQIIFTSNSPYTLSDLPKDNVIMLQNNKILSNTFANNIHTLLKEQYFMSSTIGEFAKTKIEKVLKNINNKVNDLDTINEMNQIVNNIGEDLLKNKIKEMMSELNDKDKQTK